MCRKSQNRRGDVQPIAVNTTNNLPPSYTPAETGTIRTPPRDVSLAELEKDMQDTNLYPGDNKQPLYNEAELDVLSNPGDLPAYLHPQTQGQPTTTRAIESSGPLDLLLTASRHVAAHHQQWHQQKRSHGCCRRKHRNQDQNAPMLIPDSAFEAEKPQRDLQSFNTAMAAVRAGDCCAKGKAKRAVRNLKKDLLATVEGGRKMDCAGKRQLKAEAREIAGVFKSEIKEAWHMRG